MPAVQVQKVINGDFGTSVGCTIAAATAGNLLLAVAVVQNNTVTVTAPAGFSTIPGANPLLTTVGGIIQIYVWRKAAVGGETTVAVGTSGNAYTSLEVTEVSGVATTPEDVATTTSTGVSNSATSGSADPAGAAFVFAAMGFANGNGAAAPTWSNTFTASSAMADFQASAYRVVTGGGSYTTTATWTGGSANWGMVIVAFAEVASGDTTPPNVVSRRANGPTLTITYDEAVNLDSIPGASSFTVKVNGATRAVTNVTAANNGPGGAGVFTLTLSSPVAVGDTVTVSY